MKRQFQVRFVLVVLDFIVIYLRSSPIAMSGIVMGRAERLAEDIRKEMGER